MRIVFMGTPDFALPPLAALVAAGHEVAAVYTQPPRPAGRGMAEKKSPVHLFAERHGLSTLTPKSLKGEPEPFRSLDPATATFGHGGVGSSYSWADPESGVSFSYLTNFVSPDPWHSARLDRVANLVHAAID